MKYTIIQFNFKLYYVNIDGSKIIFGLGVAGAVATAVVALFFALD